jgi:membrane dipeptidase
LRVADELDLDTTDLAAPAVSSHTDLPRMARGGVGAQFWSVFVPAARGNIHRVMREAEAASRAISARHRPSCARIEDLDENQPAVS